MSEAQALKCPSCGSFFRSEDFDSAKGLLTCSFCKALMTLQPPPGAQRGELAPRAEVPLPPGITVNKTREGLELRRRWFQPTFLFLAAFCVAWNAFLVFWYSIAFTQHAPWIMVVFPVAHVAVGVGLTYWTLAGLFNTTTIRVERRRLVVRHAPLPWKGPGAIESADVEQLYVKSTKHHGKHGVRWSYAVWIVRRDQRSLSLVGGLPEPDAALYFEQQIERALGLPDRHVPGEWNREERARAH